MIRGYVKNMGVYDKLDDRWVLNFEASFYDRWVLNFEVYDRVLLNIGVKDKWELNFEASF